MGCMAIIAIVHGKPRKKGWGIYVHLHEMKTI